MANMDVDY